MNITFKEKDKVLNILCSDDVTPEILLSINRTEFLKMSEMNSEMLNSILTYFQRIGLVCELNYRHTVNTFYLIVCQEAFDVFNRGGFTAQENMLQKEVEKLLLEVERLKPSLGNKIEQVSTIANNIAGIAGSFIGAVAGIKPF